MLVKKGANCFMCDANSISPVNGKRPVYGTHEVGKEMGKSYDVSLKTH